MQVEQLPASDASAAGRGIPGALIRRAAAPVAVAALAGLLRLIAGVGFVNYDTLYALAWGGQLAHGETPAYGVAIAPTPHPLLELLGLVLAPLGPGTARAVMVALAFLALAGCGWVLYRLGTVWFSRLAGLVAAVLFLTRVPVLSYGVRAYADVPYVLLVLAALLLESERRAREGRAGGTRVLALLAVAGLLRPEAWLFSGVYWLYLLGLAPRALLPGGERPRLARSEVAGLTALVASAPLLWLLSDLLVTGDALWSLTNTRHTASTLGRVTGIANVPEYIPRRIGEILRPPVLAGAALGGVLSLWWLRSRALPGAVAGLLAVVVFAVFAAAGLPINTRYAFLAAAVLCVFCGAGIVGWLQLPRGERRRSWWAAGAAVIVVALIAYAPSQYHSADRELGKLARQQQIEGDLLALVHRGAISLRCGPVGVPNHAPIPLLALYLKTSPANIVSAQVGHIERGVYVDPANREVEEGYVLDKRDPHVAVSVPPGFVARATNRSWLVFERCGS
ncbi:MAG TPA: hypothetical protein VHT27_12135 [Solirubrobacteraceae bacterium]|jgi:hypothetical protein|nr:hypothetical protein [Solirubrobacteraceae bacterium]